MVAASNYVFGLELGGLEHNTNSLKLGASSGATLTNLFAGMLDDVRVFPGNWGNEDVRAMWEQGADVDGDGLSAWQEYQIGTSPTNPHDPPSISGSVTYTGTQAGLIHVLATTNSDSWTEDHAVILSGPGSYQIPNLPVAACWLKAYLDSNGNGTNEFWEATGIFTNTQLYATGRVTNVNFMLNDPDTDGDGLPDYAEMTIVNASTNDNIEKVEHVLPGDDFDGDGVSNADEIRLGTDPANPASKPPVLAFSIHDVVVPETNSSATISLSLLPPATGTVQARLYVVGGTAVSGVNYSFTNQTVLFSEGQTNQQISVAILANDAREPTKTLTLRLDQLVGSAVCMPSESVTISITDAFVDSDLDGLPDSWEMRYFGNLSQTASGDPDGDGVNNLDEYLLGTEPTKGAVSDTNNVLRLQAITPMR